MKMFRNIPRTKYNYVIISGTAPGNLSVTTNLNKLLELVINPRRNVSIITACDKDLINVEKENVYNIRFYKNNLKMFVFSQLSILQRIFQIAFKQKIDIVIIAFGGDLLVLPILFLKLIGVKIIIRSDGRPSTIIKKYYKKSNKFKIFLFTLFEEINYRLSNILSSECHYMLKENRFYCYANPSVIKLYVDIEIFNKKISIVDRNYDIGYIGRFSEEKGILNFICSLPKLSKESENLKVFLAGEGELLEQVHQFLHQNNLQNSVKLLTWISHDELPKYLNDIKILVIPSINEGLPNILLEGMSCGCLVLATPVGGIPGVIRDGETGFLIKNNHQETILDGIIKVQNHNNLEQISNNAQVLISEQFEKTICQREMDTILDSIERSGGVSLH
jgi:glycosyltransferase involved in cell wall biosynthesis